VVSKRFAQQHRIRSVDGTMRDPSSAQAGPSRQQGQHLPVVDPDMNLIEARVQICPKPGVVQANPSSTSS
jgi:hypothetical protein